MVNERVEAARRKYLSLGVGELVAAAVFFGVARFSVLPRMEGQRDTLVLWSALIPLLAVLVQGSVYWLLARNWVLRSRMPRGVARLLRVMRIGNVGVLIAGLAGVLLWLPANPGWAVAVLAIWVFGVIEYLNYFVVRLSYPFAFWASEVGRWRTPRLVRDLRMD